MITLSTGLIEEGKRERGPIVPL